MNEATDFYGVVMRTQREPIEEKSPGTLTEWFELYLKNRWVEIDELMEIQMELLLHLGPVKLDKVIKAAQDLKAEYEEKAEDWF